MKPLYSEGICDDGAAILCDGKMLTITEVLNRLNSIIPYKDSNAIKIPVTIGFDHQRVIGEMRVDAARLPAEPNFHFALGYKATATDDERVTSYELVEVGLTADDKFSGSFADAQLAAVEDGATVFICLQQFISQESRVRLMEMLEKSLADRNIRAIVLEGGASVKVVKALIAKESS